VRNAKFGIFLIKLHPLKFFQVNLQTNQVLNQHPLKAHTPLVSAFMQSLLGITENSQFNFMWVIKNLHLFSYSFTIGYINIPFPWIPELYAM